MQFQCENFLAYTEDQQAIQMLTESMTAGVAGVDVFQASATAKKSASFRLMHEADRDFDFVLFLDGDATTGHARRQVEDEFCASAERSQASFNE